MLLNFKYKSNEYLLKLSNSISFKKNSKKNPENKFGIL